MRASVTPRRSLLRNSGCRTTQRGGFGVSKSRRTSRSRPDQEHSGALPAFARRSSLGRRESSSRSPIRRGTGSSRSCRGSQSRRASRQDAKAMIARARPDSPPDKRGGWTPEMVRIVPVDSTGNRGEPSMSEDRTTARHRTLPGRVGRGFARRASRPGIARPFGRPASRPLRQPFVPELSATDPGPR